MGHDDIELRVLGPCEVFTHVGPVPCRQGLESSLMAWFALHAGESVSVATTLRELWPDIDTETARRRLRHVLSQLRRRFGPAGLPVNRAGEHLEIEIRPASVDAVAFGDEVAEARRLLATGELGTAARTATGALQRWRADIAYPELAVTGPGIAAAARLAEVRLAATDVLHASDLLAGGGAGRIPDLFAVTEQHPLRELSWRHLMAALAAAGRPAEALRAFQRCRAALATVGISPGPETRAVERAVLDHVRPPDGSLLPEGLPGPRTVTGQVAPDGQAETGALRGSLGAVAHRLSLGAGGLTVIEAGRADAKGVGRAVGEQVEGAGGRVIRLDGSDRRAARRLAAAVHAGRRWEVADPAGGEQTGLSWPEMNDVVATLARLAQDQPVVLVIDEAQAMRADLATLVDELADGRRATAVVAVVTGPGHDVAALTSKAELVVELGDSQATHTSLPDM